MKSRRRESAAARTKKKKKKKLEHNTHGGALGLVRRVVAQLEVQEGDGRLHEGHPPGRALLAQPFFEVEELAAGRQRGELQAEGRRRGVQRRRQAAQLLAHVQRARHGGGVLGVQGRHGAHHGARAERPQPRQHGGAVGVGRHVGRDQRVHQLRLQRAPPARHGGRPQEEQLGAGLARGLQHSAHRGRVAAVCQRRQRGVQVQRHPAAVGRARGRPARVQPLERLLPPLRVRPAEHLGRRGGGGAQERQLPRRVGPQPAHQGAQREGVGGGVAPGRHERGQRRGVGRGEAGRVQVLGDALPVERGVGGAQAVHQDAHVPGGGALCRGARHQAEHLAHRLLRGRGQVLEHVLQRGVGGAARGPRLLHHGRQAVGLGHGVHHGWV